MADRRAEFLNELSPEDQADIVLAGWFKFVQKMLASCSSRFRLYRDSDEGSGHAAKLLGEINMVIGLLLMARSELVRIHKLDGFPEPTMADKATWEEERRER
jgi:hypothetical protein